MGSIDRVNALAVSVRRAIDRNGGVISRIELMRLGMSSSAIGRRVRSGDLQPVVPGVYRAALTPNTPTIGLRAALLRLGADAVVAERSAAWWHGLTEPAMSGVVVLVPPNRPHPDWPGVTVLRRPLMRADRQTLRGLAVTTRARTVLDCAGCPDAEAIRDRALQLGTTVSSLEGAFERFAPGNGTTAARRLIEPVRGGGVSHPERELLDGLRQVGAAAWQAGIRVRVGDRTCWVDLAVRSLRLAVEVDGWQVHSRSDAFHTDRERQNVLVAAGWTVLRYTPRHLRDDLPRVVAEIVAVQARLAAIAAENAR